MITQTTDGGHHVQTLPPLLKLADLIGNDQLRRRRRLAAGAHARLGDIVQIVQRIEKTLRNTFHLRGDIPGYGKIHQHQVTPRPPCHDCGDRFPRHYGQQARGATDHHIGILQQMGDGLQRMGVARKFFGELLTAFRTAVGYGESLHPMLPQMGRHQLDGIPGTDQQHRFAFETAQQLLGQTYGSIGDTDRGRTNGGLRAHPLCHAEGPVQQAIQYRPGGTVIRRRLIGILDLTENLRLSDDHGIQPAGHAKQVAYGFRIARMVNMPIQQSRVHAVKMTEPVLQGLTMVASAAVNIDFRAVAGGYDQRLGSQALLRQVMIGCSKPLRRKSDFFPDRDGGSMVTQSEAENGGDRPCGATIRGLDCRRCRTGLQAGAPTGIVPAGKNVENERMRSRLGGIVAGIALCLTAGAAAADSPSGDMTGEQLYYLLVAEFATAQREPQLAIPAWQEAAKLAPEPDVLVLDALLQQDDALDERLRARRLLSALADKDPKSAAAYYALGRIDLLEKRPEHAISWLEKALGIRPDWQEAAISLAEALQAVQGPAAALRSIQSFTASHPEATLARQYLAALYLQMGGLTQAYRLYQDMARQNPDDPDILLSLGLMDIDRKDWKRAESVLLRTRDLAPQSPVPVYYLGRLYEAQDRWAEALQWYQRIHSGPLYPEVELRSARVEYLLGHHDKATDKLRALAAAHPQDAQIPLLEAGLLQDSGHLPQALQVISSALQRMPEQPSLWYAQGAIYEQLKDYPAMEKAMRMVIHLAPNHAQAYNFIGYSLVERHSDLAEAQKLLTKALSLSPDNPEILDSVGWLYHARGDNDRALGYLQRAHAALPDEADVSAHLGQVLWSLGRHAEARQVWQHALLKHPDDAALKRALNRQP